MKKTDTTKSVRSKGFEKENQGRGRQEIYSSPLRDRYDPRSLRAITNIKKLCEEYLNGRYDLEVIDIYQRPTLAEGEQIIAAPTLIKNYLSPCGDSSAI